MAATYTKEFLVSAFLSRYTEIIEKDSQPHYIAMVNSFYDEVGKDKFRVSASLDADAIKTYKALKK